MSPYLPSKQEESGMLSVPRRLPSFPEPPDELSARDYLQIIRKRKWVIVTTVVVVMVIATITVLQMTPIYEAVARIDVSRETSRPLGLHDTSGDSETAGWEDYQLVQDTQANILQSDTVALEVIRKLELDRNPNFAGASAAAQAGPLNELKADEERETGLVKNFKLRLRVTKIPQTRILEVRYRSSDPKLAAEIANALVSAFLEQNFKTRFDSTRQTAEWLSRKLADLQTKVEASQAQLVRYQKANDILGLDEKVNIITSKLNELNGQLTLAEADRIQKEANAALARSENPELLPAVASSPTVQRLADQEAEIANQYSQVTSHFGESYPKVIELDRQRKQVRAAIESEQRKIAARVIKEYETALARENILRRALESQKQEANKLNSAAIQYNALKREVETNRQLHEGLLIRLKEAEVAAGLRSDNIRVVDTARAPLKPVRPDIPLTLAISLLFGLVFGTGLALLLEKLDNTLRTAEQLEAVSGLPLMGVIPLYLSPNGEGRGLRKLTASAGEEAATAPSLMLVTHARPRSAAAESYRALRTSLLLSSLEAPPKVIMITSPLPQEGKTTTSVNTAVVLAQRGGRVLLVDADMRHPNVHSYLQLPQHQGLSATLTGAAKVSDAVLQSPIHPNLFVLPAGANPPNPVELLGSDVMKRYIQQWRKEFDHIVLDTPPILSVTDGVLLSVEADIVMLVIRSGRTTKDCLARSEELLRQVNARIGGVVINALDLRREAYGTYGYGYGYGYGKYYSSESEND